MTRTKTHLLLALASIVPTSALMLAWLGNQWLASSHWLTQLSLLTVALIVAGVYASYVMAGLARSQLAAQHQLELLGTTDLGDLRQQEAMNSVNGIAPDDPWYEIIRRLHRRMTEMHTRMTEIELNQVAVEVRARRHAAEHERIAEILNNLNDPILAVDQYDELILANPRAAELFDLAIDPDEKRMVSDLVACESVVRLLQDARRRKSNRARTRELEIADATGRSRWYRTTTRTLTTGAEEAAEASDAPHGAIAILQDISGHKDIQKRHAEFVSSVSHEMKTPLAGIKAYVELLVDGDAEDEATQEEFLQVIDAQADRLRRLVENLLNIARIEAGVVQVSKEHQSLNEILEEAHSVVAHVADEKQIALTNELSSMYLGVYADRDMLLQSAINLLSNAIKYTPAGRQVVLRSRLVGEFAEFEVEDQGVGLSDEDQKRVFEKFYRVNKDKSMAAGTGLGLPLAKHIVEDVHQGRLTVWSTLEEGSTFTVRLPCAGQID